MIVIWTDESLEKLSEIDEFIARDNPQRAKKNVEFLIKHGESIAQNPSIGRVVPEISNPIIREMIVNNYRIVYKIKQNKIEILTVFEGHRLLRIEEIDID